MVYCTTPPESASSHNPIAYSHLKGFLLLGILEMIPVKISERAYHVLSLLIMHANKVNRCFPSQRTLAAKLRCSVDTVERAINVLEAAGLIIVIRKRGWHGRYAGNDYNLSPLHALYVAWRASQADRQISRRQSAKMRHGDESAARSQASSTKPQKCSIYNESKNDLSNESNNKQSVPQESISPMPAEKVVVDSVEKLPIRL